MGVKIGQEVGLKMGIIEIDKTRENVNRKEKS